MFILMCKRHEVDKAIAYLTGLNASGGGKDEPTIAQFERNQLFMEALRAAGAHERLRAYAQSLIADSRLDDWLPWRALLELVEEHAAEGRHEDAKR